MLPIDSNLQILFDIVTVKVWPILCKELVQNKDILVKSKSTKYILLISKSFIYLLLASYHSCFAKLQDRWTQSIRIAGQLALSLTDGMFAWRAVKDLAQMAGMLMKAWMNN